MSLFGSLFGAIEGGSPVVPGAIVSPAAGQPLTQEFAEMAVELIDEFAPDPNVVWVSISNDEVPDPDEPWKSIRGASIERAVKIVFFQDSLKDRQLLKYLKGTEITNGSVNGIMYRYDFEPELKDVIRWEGKELTINAIDPVSPIDKAIIYIIEFAT